MGRAQLLVSHQNGSSPYRGGRAVTLHAHLASVHLGGHARGLGGDARGDADLCEGAMQVDGTDDE